MAFKPRIIIIAATKDSMSELTIVKGREMANGQRSPGPTEEQIAIVRKAIVELLVASGDLKLGDS